MTLITSDFSPQADVTEILFEAELKPYSITSNTVFTVYCLSIGGAVVVIQNVRLTKLLPTVVLFAFIRYERHFTPNVALAPPPQEKGKSENGEVSPTPKIIEITDSTQLSPPRSSKDYREYDLPTDTDDSSIGQSSPSDGKWI